LKRDSSWEEDTGTTSLKVAAAIAGSTIKHPKKSRGLDSILPHHSLASTDTSINCAAVDLSNKDLNIPGLSFYHL
jgi:hypothetical protein